MGEFISDELTKQITDQVEINNKSVRSEDAQTSDLAFILLLIEAGSDTTQLFLDELRSRNITFDSVEQLQIAIQTADNYIDSSLSDEFMRIARRVSKRLNN